MEQKRIIIIGAGPTGLGAAQRLVELGYKNWAIYEKNNYVGGLAASFKDDRGFTWDVGGHVLFSHYEYFDNLFEKLTNKKYFKHLRESWICYKNSFVPYPFQNNIRYLPEDDLLECLNGLIEAQTAIKSKIKSDNFEDWIYPTFGNGISKHFMIPYNTKVWGFPLNKMSNDWIAERVSVINYKKLLENILLKKDDVSWGPNNKFKFPKHGGTGSIFEAILPSIKDKLSLNSELTSIDVKSKTLNFKGGRKDSYDILINTSPIDNFVKSMKSAPDGVISASKELKSNGGLIVGIGLKKPCPSNKCWIYFPENNSPFYRVTYFSNYSQYNAPDNEHYSLMCETTYSKFKKVNKDQIVEDTIQGLINMKFISKEDRKKIVSTYVIDIDKSYPIPTINRDSALKKIQPYFEKNDIYSRGRFGGWKYEIGNMDHSVMQGVEVVNRLLKGDPETVYF